MSPAPIRSLAANEPLPHWRETFAALPPALALPGVRPGTPRGAPTSLALPLPGSLGANASAFETLVAALAAVLHRTTRQGDLLLGLRVDALHAALRVRVSGTTTFAALLADVRAELGRARRDALALDELLQVAGVARSDALFTVLVTPAAPGGPDDARTEGHDLVLALPPGATTAQLVHDGGRFSAAAAGRMRGHLATLLTGALATPDVPLARLPLLTPPERHVLLVERNATARDFPRDLCLHQLFEQRVTEAPGAVAVVHDGLRVTYAELDARANRLAHHLRTLGVGPGVLAGIAAERGPELVVGLLAIAKAGGAYVPLDPAYPAERLAFLLDDSGVRVLLAQGRVFAHLPEPRIAVHPVVLDDPRWSASDPCEPPETGGTPEDLAYVIYTSGSTGTPKGVMLDHRGRVGNFLDFVRRFELGPGDAAIALASLSFDMSAFDVFGTLAAGATLVLPRQDELTDPSAWARIMARERVTVWHTAPAVLKMLVERCEAEPALAPRTLRLALLGGDWIPLTLPDRLRALVPACTVVSLGGATECSMDSTIHVIGAVDPAWRSLPYGVPMANQRAYVLDDLCQPLPALVAGELWLGGVGVARGYLGRPELTAERFRPDPFAPEPDARMYRTGDLVRWTEEGWLELLGRIDQQVKVRGHRVELGEIEARLAAHPDVGGAVVAARTDASGEQRLIGYVVPRADRSPLALAVELRARLAAELPAYMVPALIVLLDALPLSPNGKVDRKRLPDPPGGRAGHLPPLVRPRDPVEALVAGVWADVLDLDEVGVDDGFLDLGGHSILGAQVQARLAEVLPFELALRDLFDAPTVARLAQRLRAQAEAAGVDLDAICHTLRAIAELGEDEVRARYAAGA
jgi:amino acid adenylation domain-containing protein